MATKPSDDKESSTKMVAPICKNCRSYQERNSMSLGECRHDAPIPAPVHVHIPGFASAWPSVHDTDWCRKWEVRP
jgi:hypothetical protein